MKATGIVRRMDDLGRVVISKAGRVHRFVLCTTIANFYNFPKELNSCLDYSSRQSERACRPFFTDNKPFRLLKQFFPLNIV